MGKGHLASSVLALGLAVSSIATVAYLNIPSESDVSERAQASLTEPQGFMSEMTLHVLPVIPRNKATTLEEEKYESVLVERVERVADWYNQAARGKRTIFKATVLEPTIVLTPEERPSAADDDRARYRNDEKSQHECEDLIAVANGTASALGPEAVVVVIAEETWKCPFLGIAGFRANWVVLTQWDTSRNSFNQYTLVHELGHTMGLPHARSYLCKANAGVYEKPQPLATCEIREYGDPSDPMGEITDKTQAGFNAFNRYLLGWNTEPRVVKTPGVQRVTVPIATSGEQAYVEIPGGFMISYRAPNGAPDDLDSWLGGDSYFGNMSGVYLHRKASNRNDGSTYPVLLPFHRLRPTAGVGDHFVSAETNSAFVVTAVDPGKSAEIEVHVGTEDNPIQDIWGPSIVLIDSREIPNQFSYLQWEASDPSGIIDAYAVVDGKRQEARVTTHVIVPYRKRIQKVFFVAIDGQGNRAESEVYVVQPREKRDQAVVPPSSKRPRYR